MPRYVVRYGSMRLLGAFTTRGTETHSRGSQVIARTARGLELGEVLCEATDDALAALKNPGNGQILRSMTAEDANELDHLKSQAARDFDLCNRHVSDLGLDMELVDLERIFGGERMVVYYLAEQRVDFRELVKRLASEFQTRIEMRQIGVRDEAKLLADYGDCGKPVCCNTHLVTMPPVSMKMAKLQKATLDPSKISGRCGRLKCCLRYEFDTYLELQAELPRVGATILTRDGQARVLNQSILTSQVLAEMEDGRRTLIHLADIISQVGSRKPPAENDRKSGGRPRRRRGKPPSSDPPRGPSNS